MSTLAGDFWVCGDCRSINNAGARQCYNCRTPRDRAAVDPSEIDPSTHGRLREIELPKFASSRWAAMLASVLILAVAVMQVVQFNLVATLLDQILGGTTATEEQLGYVGSIGILAFGIALLALIAWSLWLSRTVTSMPALGLGYPAANGMMAFIENFLPGLNLWRVPAIVRDIVRRLEPKTGGDETMTRGEALVFAAWISLLGGFLVPRILGFVTDDIRTLITISGIGTGFVLIGAIFLVVLIWWIEGRILKRRGEQLGAMGPTTDATTPIDPGSLEPSAPAAPDVIETRPAFAAAANPAPSNASPFRLPGGEGATSVTAERPVVADTVLDAPLHPTPEAPPPPVFEPAEPAVTVEASRPVAAPEPVPVVSEPAPLQPAEPVPPVPAEPASTPAPVQPGPPNLLIRVSSRGMMTAEMDGESEHVMLDDLSSYAEALSHVGGTATIVVPSAAEGMPELIAKRAQRILEDAGVSVTTA